MVERVFKSIHRTTHGEVADQVLSKCIDYFSKLNDPRLIAAFAYGSYVQGRFRIDSDLDLAILDRPNKSLVWGDQAVLMEALEREIGIPIDLRMIREGSESYQLHVMTQGILLWCGDPAALEQYALKVQQELDQSRDKRAAAWEKYDSVFCEQSMPLNNDYLLEQLRLIDDYLSRTRTIAQKSLEEFLANAILVDAAIREIIVLFETCHNIAKHIISETGLRESKTKAEAFEVLAEQGILARASSDNLIKASRFRNLATYQTTVLDDRKVFEILQTGINDFEAFASQIAKWLEIRNV